MRTHQLCYCVCVCTSDLLYLFFLRVCFESVFWQATTCIHTCWCMCMSVFVFQIFSENQKDLMLFPSSGRALPSHYTGSRTNHRLRVSVSPNLSLFSLLSLVIFLFHSLRQLPSPTCPQSTLITFFSCVYFISLFFPPSYLSHSSILPPLVSSHSLRSSPCWLHIVSCCMFLFFLSLLS